MTEKKQTQVMPGMLRNLNKQAQGGGIIIPTSNPTSRQPVQQTVQQVVVAQTPDVQEPAPHARLDELGCEFQGPLKGEAGPCPPGANPCRGWQGTP